jgi:hypothetical protein
MSLNGAVATGDDQKWKREAEKKIADYEKRIKKLESAIGRLSKGK